MAHKSIVDRVLILAAAICAAALVWQLTVLLTAKGRTSNGASLVAVASVPSATTADVGQQSGSAPAPVRVVYAGTEPSAKTSVKASDPPATPSEPDPARPEASAAVDLPGPAASAVHTSSQPATQPVTSTMSQPADSAAESADQTASTTASAAVSSRVDIASAEPPAPGDDPVASKSAATGAVDLNHASIEALNHLKGAGHIGQAIVSHRPYRSVEDLVRKRVLRRGVYEQIKQMVVTE